MAEVEQGRQHISGQFHAELEAAKAHVLEMGGQVEQQILSAVNAWIKHDSGLAEDVIRQDREINRMEVAIDNECFRILARRQPAASDLRLVLAIGKVVTDLERAGDEACKIALQAISRTEVSAAGDESAELRQLANQVVGLLRWALDAFARMDANQALEVAQGDREADAEYAAALHGLVNTMSEQPDTIQSAINELWALRSLERVGDHSRNIAEYVIYQVKGVDVRHMEIDELVAFVQNDD